MVTMNRILKLAATCHRLEYALVRSRERMSAAEQRYKQRSERMHLAVGAALEAAMAHLWTAAETQWFLDEVAQMYPRESLNTSIDNFSAPETVDEATRARQVLWGSVGCELIACGRVKSTDFELAVFKFLRPQVRRLALRALEEGCQEAHDRAREHYYEIPPFSDFALLLRTKSQ
jgi:hypothetical protein